MSTITVRFAYEVRGVVKFLSHLDILKLFNRALLRAGLPVAYSEGFNPHAKISFCPPRGVGQEGWREYCDLQLKECELTAEEICRRLNQALPKGVRVLDGRVLAEPRPALMAEINLAVYEAVFGGISQKITQSDAAYLRERLAEFAAAEKVEVVRHHPKKRDKLIDLKAGVAKLELAEAETNTDTNRLILEIPFGEAGSVKPVEVLDWLVGDWVGLEYKLSRAGMYVVDKQGARRLP